MNANILNADDIPATNTNPHIDAIMAKAFNIPEITELILAQMPLKDLLVNIPRVCQTWLAHTKNPVLQKITFHRPEEAPEVETVEEEDSMTDEIMTEQKADGQDSSEEDDEEDEEPWQWVAASRLIGQSPLRCTFSCQSWHVPVRFNPFFLREFAWDDQDDLQGLYGEELIPNIPEISQASLLDPKSSSYKMLLTQPPLYSARLYFNSTTQVSVDCGATRDHYEGNNVIITNASGIRLGEVLGAAKRMASEQRLKVDEYCQSRGLEHNIGYCGEDAGGMLVLEEVD